MKAATSGTAGAPRKADTLGTLTWAALGLGVVLRCIAYFERSILWLDEAATARNLVERSLGDLLTLPLDYGQAAPKGFLLLQWLVVHAFGTSELAFRLVPFVSGLVSLVLFRRIALRCLEPAGALVAMLFFAVGYWFLLYSAELHPYGLDLALGLGAVSLALDVRASGYARERVWTLAVYGAVIVWFSYAAVLTLAGLGLALGALAWKDNGFRSAVSRLWPLAVLWTLNGGVAVWVALQSFFPRTAEFMDWFWRYAMAPVPRSAESVMWLWNAWRTQLVLFHGWNLTDPTWTSLYVALALIGFLSFALRRTADAIVIGSIVAIPVLASMAKQYPYEARFLLVSLAVFVLGIGEAVGVLAKAQWHRATPIARAMVLLLCVPPVFRIVTHPPPYQWTVTGSYLAQIRDRWQPGDVLYTSYGRGLEVLHSAPRFGLSPSDVIIGSCPYESAHDALHAVDPLRERRRAWVLVSSGGYFPSSPEYAYLRAIGVRRDSLRVELPGTYRFFGEASFDIPTAYLFDLSDTARLSRTTADSYVPSPVMRRTVRAVNKWNCYGVWAPRTRESDAVRRTATTIE